MLSASRSQRIQPRCFVPSLESGVRVFACSVAMGALGALGSLGGQCITMRNGYSPSNQPYNCFVHSTLALYSRPHKTSASGFQGRDDMLSNISCCLLLLIAFRHARRLTSRGVIKIAKGHNGSVHYMQSIAAGLQNAPARRRVWRLCYSTSILVLGT